MGEEGETSSGSGLGKRRVGHLSKFCGTPTVPLNRFRAVSWGETKPTREMNVMSASLILGSKKQPLTEGHGPCKT